MAFCGLSYLAWTYADGVSVTVTQKPDTPAYEHDSPYINAPVWPWSLAGYSTAALWLLLLLFAWLRASD